MPDLRDHVDLLLRAEKTPVGEPAWGADPRHENATRAVIPLQVGSSISTAEWTIRYYPDVRPLKFRLILTVGAAVFRVDYADEVHVNDANAADDIRLLSMCCPHYHSWDDNRRFSTEGSLPKKLHNARILPANLQSYDNVVRWFCGQTNIVLGAFVPPTPPTPDRLL